MKKIKVLLIAAMGTLGVVSCNDALDIVQKGEITEEVAFQTVGDLQSFLIGNVYGTVDTSNEIQLSSILTDETALTPQNPGHYFQEFRYGLMTNTGQVSSIWGTHYATINRVNRLLAYAEKITPSADEQQQYNSILAEARTLRAFAYLSLTSYFTTNMKDNSALGVILSTTVPEIDAQLPRSTNGEIYAQIEADLAYAEANFVAPSSTDVPYKFVTRPLIDAIRARMYTYRGDYANAKLYAQKVINASNPLTLAVPFAPASFLNSPSSNPYKRIWQDVGQQEIIFALSRPSLGSGGIASLWTTNTTSLTGTPLLGVSHNLFDLLDTPGDIRLYTFVDPESIDHPTTKVLDKYPGKGSTPLKNDIKVFRVSEMYLILAEAAIAENNLTQAATYIQQIRSARKYTAGPAALPVYTSQAQAYRDMLKERRVELCFEGHRYIDLRRLGATAGVTNDRNAMDDYFNPNTPLSLSITDHRWTLPIPQAEILGNPSIQQNPGY